MRIGIFGGSFDPIHLGHLILAEQCREQASLDEVWFVPSATQPHKKSGATATDRQRCEMIEFALAGHESFSVSKIELERGGVSYTVDTLRQIREQNPLNELFFLIGADSLDSFRSWREPAEILQLASPLVVNRPGAEPVDLQNLTDLVDAQWLAEFASLNIESPLIGISSSDLRRRIAAGESVRYQVPRSVEKYIETQKLYGKPSV